MQRETLDRLAELMKSGAELRLATDDPSYLPWMVEHACTHPAFEWLAECPADWRGRPDDWPPTRYERKMLAGALADVAAACRDLGLQAGYQNHSGAEYVGAAVWDAARAIDSNAP